METHVQEVEDGSHGVAGVDITSRESVAGDVTRRGGTGAFLSSAFFGRTLGKPNPNGGNLTQMAIPIGEHTCFQVHFLFHFAERLVISYFFLTGLITHIQLGFEIFSCRSDLPTYPAPWRI